MNHGLFTFADDARTAYERMIAGVDRAERFVHARACTRPPPGRGARPEVPPAEAAARLAPVLRGALAEATGDAGAPGVRRRLRHRASEATPHIRAGAYPARIPDANPLTPDHVIRTKGPALLLPGDLPLDDAKALRERLDAVVATYRAAYDAYFEANRQRARTRVTKLDSFPRVVLVPGVGIVAAGRTKQEAHIAADIAEHTLRAKALASAIGRYAALGDADLFDMEYWSLEQAKLGAAKEAALAGQVALVTGAAGAIGFAICQKLIDAGAHVVAADLGGERLDAAVGELDPRRRGLAAGVVMDVTVEHSVAAGCAEACRLYGGVDILVLNAGVAHVSPIEATDVAAFRRVVDVNLTGYFLVLREAAALFRRQGTGGNVIVNSSKNVFAPGADFGAYSASKAGAHQLCTVAALELAARHPRVPRHPARPRPGRLPRERAAPARRTAHGTGGDRARRRQHPSAVRRGGRPPARAGGHRSGLPALRALVRRAGHPAHGPERRLRGDRRALPAARGVPRSRGPRESLASGDMGVLLPRRLAPRPRQGGRAARGAPARTADGPRRRRQLGRGAGGGCRSRVRAARPPAGRALPAARHRVRGVREVSRRPR